MNVSVFPDVTKVTRPPSRVNVDTVLERIQSGDNGLAELIGKIRSADGNRELLKKQLGAVIFSGYCGNGVEKVNRSTGNKYLSYRDDPSLTEHSGLCVIDLDHLDNVNKWKEHFKADTHVYSLFLLLVMVLRCYTEYLLTLICIGHIIEQYLMNYKD